VKAKWRADWGKENDNMMKRNDFVLVGCNLAMVRSRGIAVSALIHFRAQRYERTFCLDTMTNARVSVIIEKRKKLVLVATEMRRKPLGKGKSQLRTSNENPPNAFFD
jgi:hypothetical protein